MTDNDTATPPPVNDPCPWYLMPGMRCDGQRNHDGRCYKEDV